MEIVEQLEEYDFADCPIIKVLLESLEIETVRWGDKIMELMDAVQSFIPDPET